MPRAVLILHRWLGVIIGAVMTIWCLSGFVMMYVDYPRLTPAEQLRGLAPLQLPGAAAWGRVALPDDMLLASARVENRAGQPVLRIVPAGEPGRRIAQMRATPGGFALPGGQPLATLAAAQARAVAVAHGRHSGIAGAAGAATETDIDQWTVQTFRRNRPLYRVDYADAGGTSVYVSGVSGEVVQQTTRFERFWGWLGAVPHWLYPTMLRQNGAVWAQVVIWTSLIGCFLSITGLWVGIARLRRRKDGRIGSPYKGLWWWHHVYGLFFGLLTLSWVASGLFSMNPWGFLDSMAGRTERERLAGPMQWGAVKGALARAVQLPPGTVRVETAPLGGRVFLSAIDGAGRITRLDAAGLPHPLERDALAGALKTGPGVQSLVLLREPDAYHYPFKTEAKLPVWRAILSDAEQTRLYIDAESGTLLRAVDRNGRSFRWLQDGMHRLDLPILRSRPLWDLVVVPLLAAVTIVCGTGTWMGMRKAVRDLRRFRRRVRRRRSDRVRHPRTVAGPSPQIRG